MFWLFIAPLKVMVIIIGSWLSSNLLPSTPKAMTTFKVTTILGTDDIEGKHDIEGKDEHFFGCYHCIYFFTGSNGAVGGAVAVGQQAGGLVTDVRLQQKTIF